MPDLDLPAACQQDLCTPVGVIRWPHDPTVIPYRSIAVCGSPAHQERARQLVLDHTGHDGEFVAWADRHVTG